jgi:hypothetical protein
MKMRYGAGARRAMFLFVLTALWSPAARAEDSEARHEAAKHFQRGVTLYGEADYRGALVEFKRAAGFVPNPAVLYNIGETEYQLQEYASALTTFERYLAESAASDPHRAEVETNVQALKSRVGRVTITTSPPGADITIDEQPIGKAPLDKPVLVSIGRRKIIATLSGRPPATKFVDVAAEDVVAVTLALPAALGATAPTAAEIAPAPPQPHPPAESRGSAWRTAGWIATGAFAAAAGTFGVLALNQSSDLKTERGAYPTNAATLDHAANLTTRYSVLADSFAAAAVVVGGITLFSTLSSGGTTEPSASAARVSVGFASLRVEAAF